MAYNYRLILTRDPANRIMVEKPANYDPAIAKAAAGGGFVPNLPNNKVAWNGGRLIGPQNEYPGGDWPTREAISRHYLDAMLMRLWWIQNDPEAPQANASSSPATDSPPTSSPTTTTCPTRSMSARPGVSSAVTSSRSRTTSSPRASPARRFTATASP